MVTIRAPRQVQAVFAIAPEGGEQEILRSLATVRGKNDHQEDKDTSVTKDSLIGFNSHAGQIEWRCGSGQPLNSAEFCQGATIILGTVKTTASCQNGEIYSCAAGRSSLEPPFNSSVVRRSRYAIPRVCLVGWSFSKRDVGCIWLRFVELPQPESGHPPAASSDSITGRSFF